MWRRPPVWRRPPAPVENNGLQAINLEELTQDWDKTANPMTVALAEGMENVTFTAHFKLAEVTLGEGAYLEPDTETVMPIWKL